MASSFVILFAGLVTEQPHTVMHRDSGVDFGTI